MKTAIISDIHGNFPALKAALAKIDAAGCGRIVCLGDIAGYYCMVEECIAELRARGVACIAGNHDRYLAHNIPCPRSRTVDEIIAAQRKTVSAESIAWLAALPLEMGFDGVRAVHGGWNDFTEEYLVAPDEGYFTALGGGRFASGHTHKQLLLSLPSGGAYCNPGSVGQPRDRDPRAAFAILENGSFTLERAEYDIDATAAAMKAAGFAQRFYENLYEGRGIRQSKET